MESALRALLTSYAPLTALVGTSGSKLSIEWGQITQGRPDPAVSLFLIDRPRDYTYSGPIDLTASLVQINVRARTVTDMWAVSEAIIERLSGYRAGVFGGIFLRGERQNSEDTDTAKYQTNQLDFEVWHKPA